MVGGGGVKGGSDCVGGSDGGGDGGWLRATFM